MIKMFLWSSLFFVFLSSPIAQSGSIHSKPNIVLIMADDLGYETLSVNGGQSYQTPNLDRLAHSGALFTNAFSQPLCTPSRVKLMTGLSNIRNYVKFGRLERSETTFANLMKKAGYKTVVAGKWQLGTEADSPTHFGFSQSLLWQHTTEDASTTRPALKKKYDSRYPNPELQRNGHMEYFDSGEYGPDLMSKYLTNFIANNKEVPFLIYYPMLLPHAPFEPTPDSQHWDGTKWGALKYRGDGDIAYQQNNFADMVNYMDKIVGTISDSLKEHGLAENTLIIFIGDNGSDYPQESLWRDRVVKGGKGTLTDTGVRVPMVVSWPGTVEPGLVTDELIDFSDFLPTILEVAQIPMPQNFTSDGKSFYSTLLGKPGRQKKSVYLWYRTKQGGTEVMVRNKKYSLVKNHIEGYGIQWTFWDASKRFQSKSLDLSQLTPKEETIMQFLQQRMNDFEASALAR